MQPEKGVERQRSVDGGDGLRGRCVFVAKHRLGWPVHTMHGSASGIPEHKQVQSTEDCESLLYSSRRGDYVRSMEQCAFRAIDVVVRVTHGRSAQSIGAQLCYSDEGAKREYILYNVRQSHKAVDYDGSPSGMRDMSIASQERVPNPQPGPTKQTRSTPPEELGSRVSHSCDPLRLQALNSC